MRLFFLFARDLRAGQRARHRRRRGRRPHAPGARFQDKGLGSYGDIGCFSFFSNKNMTTGEGGMLTTSNDELAERIRLLRSHGMTTLSWQRHAGHARRYEVKEIGFNYRTSDINAAIGRAQLKKLLPNNQRRGDIVAAYRKRFVEIDGVSVPFSAPRGSPAYHIFPVLLAPGASREKFMEDLASSGVQTSVHYEPVHHFSAYRERFPTDDAKLPVTEDVARRLVTLPLHPHMTEADVEIVCDAVKAAL